MNRFEKKEIAGLSTIEDFVWNSNLAKNSMKALILDLEEDGKVSFFSSFTVAVLAILPIFFINLYLDKGLLYQLLLALVLLLNMVYTNNVMTKWYKWCHVKSSIFNGDPKAILKRTLTTKQNIQKLCLVAAVGLMTICVGIIALDYVIIVVIFLFGMTFGLKGIVDQVSTYRVVLVNAKFVLRSVEKHLTLQEGEVYEERN